MRQELRQQAQVEAPIFVAKEDRLPVIPALGNVMRSSWNNLALSPWHQQLSALKPHLLSVPEVFDPVFPVTPSSGLRPSLHHLRQGGSRLFVQRLHRYFG